MQSLYLHLIYCYYALPPQQDNVNMYSVVVIRVVCSYCQDDDSQHCYLKLLSIVHLCIKWNVYFIPTRLSPRQDCSNIQRFLDLILKFLNGEGYSGLCPEPSMGQQLKRLQFYRHFQEIQDCFGEFLNPTGKKLIVLWCKATVLQQLLRAPTKSMLPAFPSGILPQCTTLLITLSSTISTLRYFTGNVQIQGLIGKVTKSLPNDHAHARMQQESYNNKGDDEYVMGIAKPRH